MMSTIADDITNTKNRILALQCEIQELQMKLIRLEEKATTFKLANLNTEARARLEASYPKAKGTNKSSSHLCYLILQVYLMHYAVQSEHPDRDAVVAELARMGVKTVKGKFYSVKHLSDTLIHCFNIRAGADKTQLTKFMKFLGQLDKNHTKVQLLNNTNIKS